MTLTCMGSSSRIGKVDAVMNDKALAVINRHEWYLVNELIPFSFFSNKVDMDMKSYTAARSLTFTPQEKFDFRKPEFLETKPNSKLVDYMKIKEFVRAVKTVNDCAERGVKIITN